MKPGGYDDVLKRFMEIDGRQGIPEDVFIAISTVMPIVNVDLLVLDDEKRILLSWRDDVYFGKGWHLPGGCIRYKETMMERIQKTALNEIGTRVIAEPEPIAVKDVIMGKEESRIRARAHQLAVLYKCTLPKKFRIDNLAKSKNTPGYLKWFELIPEDILAVHSVYHDVFRQYGLVL